MNRGCLLTWVGLLSCFSSGAWASDTTDVLRPVTSAFEYRIGSSHVTDTYLSPIKYSGWTMGVGYDRWQAMRCNPRLWSMNLHMDLQVDRTMNPVRSAIMWGFYARFNWGFYRRLHLPGQIEIGLGLRPDVTLGCLYMKRNGNNPASAKASVTIDATAYAARRFGLKGLTVDLKWTSTLALIGAFFSPEYGELYYEIWLGNRSGLAHCAWPGDFFRWNNRVTADLWLGHTMLRLGYAGEMFTSRVNHITTREFTHSLVIGVGSEWITMSPTHRLAKDAMVISATY